MLIGNAAKKLMMSDVLSLLFIKVSDEVIFNKVNSINERPEVSVFVNCNTLTQLNETVNGERTYII